MTAAGANDQALSQRLRRIWEQFLGILQAAGSSGDLGDAIEGALGVEGDSTAVQSYLSLLSTGGAEAQAELPRVELAEAESMAGANGAYVGALNLILINSDWLAGASDAEVIRVLAEEYGHSLDAKFNTQDTAGDEGERFAALLLGYEPPAASALENDTITVTIDGVTYIAEAAVSEPTGGGSSWTDPIKYNGDSAADSFTFPNSSAIRYTQYITDSSGNLNNDIDIIITGSFAGNNDKIIVRNSGLPSIDRNNTTAGSNGKEILVIESIRTSTAYTYTVSAATYPTVDAFYVARNAYYPNTTQGYRLEGNAGANTIGGGPQPDTLVGGAGKDVLYGNVWGTSTTGGGTELNKTEGGDTYDSGLNDGVTDVCYYTTSNLGEAAVAAAFSLQATSTTASNTRQRRNIDNFKVSTFTIGENSDIYIFSDYSRYTLFNQTGSINQFVFNPALLQPGREDGFLVTNFVQRQGLVKIYEALADGTVTEIIQAKKANNNVNIEEFFKQIVLTPVAPGTEFERNGNGSFQPVAGSIPVGILAASNEDSPRIIRAEELSGDGLIDVRELSPLSGYKSFSSPLTDDSGGTYWIYEPLDNDDSSVRFRANLIAYSQEFTLDLLPVNDAPTITSSGVYSFTRTGDNAPSSPSKPSDILTPPENPLSQTGINWSEVDDDFTPTFIPKKGLAITNVIALGTWQYSNDGGSNWANIGFVSETHALLIDESWSIRYVPDGQNAETAFFNFRAWDQTSGNAGQTANTSTNGGTSAYSTGIAKAQIIVDRINDPPVANPDVATAIEAGGLSNGTAGTDPTGNVLTNDTDVDNTNAELSVASFGTGAIPGSGSEGMDGDAALAGSYGELTLASNGAYTYTVDNTNATVQGLRTSSNTLTEVFNYTVRDPEGATDATTLTITITGANDNPVAVADTATAGEAGGIDNGTAGIDPTGNVLTNDTDVDSGDSKTVQSFRTGAIPGSGSEGMVGDAALAGSYGKLTLASNGTYTYTVTNTNPAVQALRTSSDTLTDSFNYTVVDAAGASDATTLIVTITGANDNPVAVADTASVVEAGGGTTPVNTAASSTTGDVFTNDTDVDEYNETKTVTAIRTGAPLGSGTAGSVGSALPGSFGSLTLASNGTYTYELNNTNAAVQALASAAATLTDTFTYTVADAAGATAAAALTVTITGVNDAPELNTAVSPSLISVTQNAPAPSNGSTAGSTLVSALVAGSSDVDAGAVKGIAITALNLQGGELRYSTDNGGTWRSLTTASETAALLLNSDATTRLYFQPAAGFTGSISNVFRFRAWDQTSGTAGQTANTSTNGGTSAFSTAIDDVAVTVSPLIWTETTKSSTTSLQGPEVFANVNFTSPPAGFVAYPIGLAMRGLTGTTASSVNLNTDGPTQDIRIGVANNTIDAGRNANSNETLILSLLQDARAIRLDFYGFGSTNSAGLDSGDTAQVTFSGVDNNGNRINVPTSTASTTISAGSLTAGPNGFNSRLLPIPTELAALRLPEIRIRATGGSFQLDYAVQVQADAITGTPGPDTLTGTLTRNIIHALAGDDNIIGGDGDDLIWAGSGSNNINGGLGSDVFGFQQFDSVPTSGATPFTNTILAPTTGAYGDRIYFRNASSVAAPVQISSAAGNNRWQATVNWGGTTTEIFEFLLPTGVSLTKGTGQAATPTSLTFF